VQAMLQRLGGHTRLRAHPSLRVAAFETLCAVGDTSVAFESGIIATHADGSVLATQTNSEGKRTSVLATVVADSEPRFSRNGVYTPLAIDFRRPEYAGNMIPRTRNRRQMAPSDAERKSVTVLSRAVQALFPSGWLNDTHITAIMHETYQGDPNAEVLAANAVSAALVMSGVPWAGPVGVVRVAMCEGELVVNPSGSQLGSSEWSMLYGGTAEDCVLLDFAVRQQVVDQESVGAACRTAHEHCQAIIHAQLELSTGATCGTPAGDVVEFDDMLVKAAAVMFGDKIAEASRKGGAAAVETVLQESAKVLIQSQAAKSFAQAHTVLKAVERQVAVPEADDLAPKSHEWRVPLFPGLHGSALLTTPREEGHDTQVMANVTIASGKDAYQADPTDDLAWPERRLMVHHMQPGFSEPSTTWLKHAGGDEIADGDFVERAISPALPPARASRTVRVSSQVMQAAGSVCSATVNATMMALRHADVGTELVAAVTISATQAADGESVLLRCDPSSTAERIHSAAMQIAGTSSGITACRAFSVGAPVPLPLLERMLQASEQPRLDQLQMMESRVLDLGPSKAPACATLKIASSNVGKLIGRGGATIQLLQSSTGSQIEIDRDSGAVSIFAPSKAAVEDAKAQIEKLMGEPSQFGSPQAPQAPQAPAFNVEVGAIFQGTVTKVTSGGVVYELSSDGKSMPGFCPMAMLEKRYTEDATKVVAVGDTMPLKVVEQRGRMGMPVVSRKDAMVAPQRQQS